MDFNGVKLKPRFPRGAMDYKPISPSPADGTCGTVLHINQNTVRASHWPSFQEAPPPFPPAGGFRLIPLETVARKKRGGGGKGRGKKKKKRMRAEARDAGEATPSPLPFSLVRPVTSLGARPSAPPRPFPGEGLSMRASPLFPPPLSLSLSAGPPVGSAPPIAALVPAPSCPPPPPARLRVPLGWPRPPPAWARPARRRWSSRGRGKADAR